MTERTEAQILAERCEESAEGWEREIDTRLKAADLLLRLDAEVRDLQSSVDFYKRRCDLLQKWQSQMRDPERIIVCDILANGLVMPEGGRYALSGTAPAPARVPLTDEQRKQVFRDAANSMVRNINLSWRNAVVEAVEAAHGITGDAA